MVEWQQTPAWEGKPVEHIKTLNGATLKKSAAHGGCGECQTSCQSACKTSCTVANQKCENQDNK
jgi:predicted ribosomally synthesized six-cysteine peptide SCIFF